MDKNELAKRLVEVIDDRAIEIARGKMDDCIATRDLVRCAIDSKHDAVVEILTEVFRSMSPASLNAVIKKYHLNWPGQDTYDTA